MTFRRAWWLVPAVVLASACEGDPTSSGGSGTETVTTWGEGFIEQGIPAGDGASGFVDGWAVKYDKFLVSFHAITIADEAGNVVFRQDTPVFVDNTKVGVKTMVPAFSLPARAYPTMTYQIKPAVAGETVAAGDPADLQMMIDNGYSIYVSATATKDGVEKTFRWGFKTATQYSNCQQAPEDNGGSIVFGVVVTTGGTDVTQLTTHGDHLYYDRLQASPDPAKKTFLRFQEKADADADGDGDITLRELCAREFDTDDYNPSGFNVASVGDFVIELARTIGHFRGEGECEISGLEDPPPPEGHLACDDYR